MLHEISAYDLLNSISETLPETPDSNEDSQDSDTLLLHATSIRQYISCRHSQSPIKRKDTS
jgi:hypothetical protein